MIMEVTRRYEFIAGHFLPNVPDGHKCKNQHGHNYAVEITVRGPLTRHTRWVIDFWDLDRVVQPMIDLVDHKNLNDIKGLSNPTAEVIAVWFLDALVTDDVLSPYTVSKVRVFETDDCIATVLNTPGDNEYDILEDNITAERRDRNGS